MFSHDFFINLNKFFDETASVFLMIEEVSVDIDTVADFHKAEEILTRTVFD